MHSRLMMTLGTAALLTLVLQSVAAADWEYAEWLENGTGNWSSPARWKDGKLPADTRNVKITGCDAFATDEDYDILPTLTRIRFSGKATLDLRFNEDHEDLSLWTVQNLSGKDFSRLIKSGTGTLSYATDRETSIVPDRLDVTNGVLLVKKAGKSTDGETHVFGVYSRANWSSRTVTARRTSTFPVWRATASSERKAAGSCTSTAVRLRSPTSSPARWRAMLNRPSTAAASISPARTRRTT